MSSGAKKFAGKLVAWSFSSSISSALTRSSGFSSSDPIPGASVGWPGRWNMSPLFFLRLRWRFVTYFMMALVYFPSPQISRRRSAHFTRD